MWPDAGRGDGTEITPSIGQSAYGAPLRASNGVMLVTMDTEIEREFAWIGRIGTEASPADRTGIFTCPYAFTIPGGDYRPEADFFWWHI